MADSDNAAPADDDTQNAANSAPNAPAPVDPVMPIDPTPSPELPIAPIQAGSPIFIVTKQPTPGGTISFTGDPFASLDEATTDADRLAILQPGVTFLVFESRRSAAVPIPDVVNTDIPQV